MAKANQRFVGTMQRTHACSGDYKIPLEDRIPFLNTNTKWVTEKKYKEYIRWKKEGKPVKK